MRTHSERHGHHSDFGFVILHVQMMVDQSPHWARHRLHVSDSYQPMELATCSDDLETAPGNLPADSQTFYHNVTELPLIDNPARGGYAGSGRTESFSRSQRDKRQRSAYQRKVLLRVGVRCLVLR